MFEGGSGPSIEMTLQGATSGNSFLIAPQGDDIFPAMLSLQSLDGNRHKLMLRSDSAGAEIELPDRSIEVGADPVFVDVVARSASQSQNDTKVIAILEDDQPAAIHNVTVIESVGLRFRGRFQCRLATDDDDFDEPWGTELSSFRAYSVQGPNPNDPDEPPLDRIIRFQKPVALRDFCEPIGVFVSAVQGIANGQEFNFASGDGIIGAPVQLGPKCMFDSQNGAIAQAGWEPISEFELMIGSFFSGKSEPGARRRRGQPHPTTAPYPEGFEFMDVVGGVQPGDFGYPESNWRDRGLAMVSEKLQKLENQHIASDSQARIRARRIEEHKTNARVLAGVATRVERYSGTIHIDVSVDSAFSPATRFLSLHEAFGFYAEFFNFDSDCLSGSVWGRLSASVPPVS